MENKLLPNQLSLQQRAKENHPLGENNQIACGETAGRQLPPLYAHSLNEAKRQNCFDEWKASRKVLIDCKDAVEQAIARDHDGYFLSKYCAQSVIEKFGYHYTGYVLANSVQQICNDGRISKEAREWANQKFIPPDTICEINLNAHFAAFSHPGLLDLVVKQYIKAYQALGLFDHTHCEPNKETQNFDGKVLVLSADVLTETHLNAKDQLWLCTGGFGASPNASGRAVFATCLSDGEKARWQRTDFAGVLTDSNLPDWARDALQIIQQNEQRQSDEAGNIITMG